MIDNYSIGIMQGRLTKPEGRGIQFFPFDNWINEFYIAEKLGIDEIEFIFDYEGYQENPFWSEDGITTLQKTIRKSGVKIKSVCFDYFMRRAFYMFDKEEYYSLLNENKAILRGALQVMETLKIGLVEIPLVDNSSLKTSEEKKQQFREFLLPIVEETNADIRFALETDLPPQDFKNFLESFSCERIGANYDSGNSSGLGYDAYEEVTTLRDFIYNIHIKDRKYHGTTVKLGTGSADFDKLFKGLNEIGYKDSFILQAARDKEGFETENIKAQMEFVESYIKKYL